MPVAQLKRPSTRQQLRNSKTKHLYLKIQDDKYGFFMELVRNFDFVRIEHNKLPEAKSEKEKITANIRKGFLDKKAIDKGELKTFPIEDLFNE